MAHGGQDWTEAEQVGGLMARLQESLSEGRVTSETMEEDLQRLQERLMRVRRWGGAFAAIEFSPDIERLLARKASGWRATVAS